jgi:hypothetical protein
VKQQETFVLIILIVVFHGVLNMQETNYGVQPTNEILREGMKHEFERMCIFYERLDAKVCFFLFTQSYIYIYIYIYICL